jgi:DNA-binding NtrC family response regulator
MKTILLVEDDAVLRHALDRTLTEAGYFIVAAEDTMAALDAIAAHRIDLLVTDIVMPQGKPHGLALARMARMRRPDFPVIFMTGYHDIVPRDVELPGRLFEKPIDTAELVQAIDDLFASQQPAPETA